MTATPEVWSEVDELRRVLEKLVNSSYFSPEWERICDEARDLLSKGKPMEHRNEP